VQQKTLRARVGDGAASASAALTAAALLAARFVKGQT
jgi:hypothetical protein